MEKAIRFDASEGISYINPALLSGSRVDVAGELFIHQAGSGGVIRPGDDTGTAYLKKNVFAHHSSKLYGFGSASVPRSMAATAQYGIGGRIQKQINKRLRADYNMIAGHPVPGSEPRYPSESLYPGDTVFPGTGFGGTYAPFTIGRRRLATGTYVYFVDANAYFRPTPDVHRGVTIDSSAGFSISAHTSKLIQYNRQASINVIGTNRRRIIFGTKTAEVFLGTISLARAPRRPEAEIVDIGAILSGRKGSTEVRFRLFVSDIYGNELTEIKKVDTASVSMSNYRDNTWELTLDMMASDILDPYADFVRPVMDILVRTRDGNERWERFPLGLYRFDVAGPASTLMPHLRRWSLTGQSPEILLLGDTAATGYTVTAGTKILLTVKNLLNEKIGVPFNRIDFPPKDKVLTQTMYFDPAKDANSVYWLRIINGLLAAGGWSAIYTDGDGMFKTISLSDPGAREATLNYGVGGDPIVVGEVKDNFAESEFANRVVVRSNDVNQVPPLVAVAVNNNENSPASVLRLKRTITKEISVQNVVGQAELDAMAQDELSRLSGRYRKLSLTSIPDPRIVPRQIMNLELHDTDDNVMVEGRWRIINQTLPLTGDRMSHELARSEEW